MYQNHHNLIIQYPRDKKTAVTPSSTCFTIYWLLQETIEEDCIFNHYKLKTTFFTTLICCFQFVVIKYAIFFHGFLKNLEATIWRNM